MDKPQVLLWTPRVLGILFILFISLFALDVFGEYRGWELLLALFGHLRWSILLLIALILAWRWEWVGSVGFGAWVVWYLAAVRGIDQFGALVFAVLPFLVAMLYLMGWAHRKTASGIAA